ncbi:TPA_asm: hypothetical protein [Porphyromonas phage phage028a_KCOM2799]|uniref:Uncharacterized protein n=1 Tax=Porphyromonas phage phage028a_KCOM2799 TaxID=3154118 RepID=A0AAT9JME3_9CAUD|nr:hypothetical protein [Porphyromonas gingivalis]
MNKELCNQIGVAILGEMATKALDNLTVSPQMMLFPFVFNTDDFSIESSVNKGEHGIRYEIDKHINIDLPDPAILAKFNIRRRCIVCLKSSKGDTYIIGSRQFPAVVSVLPHLNKAVLHLKHASISPQFG